MTGSTWTDLLVEAFAAPPAAAPLAAQELLAAVVAVVAAAEVVKTMVTDGARRSSVDEWRRLKSRLSRCRY